MNLDELLPYLAGVAAIPVINFAKNRLNLSGRPVFILSVVVSDALGIGAVAFFGENGFDLARDFTAAFAAATVIYKLLP